MAVKCVGALLKLLNLFIQQSQSHVREPNSQLNGRNEAHDKH